jgi:VanW like protein
VSDQPYSLRTNDRRVIPLLLLGLVLLFGGLYVAGYLFTSDRIPRSTSVAGIDIGGMTPAAARLHLTNELTQRMTTPIAVTASGHRMRIRPASAGLGVDVAASVESAGAGRSWSPARMWDYFNGGGEADPVVLMDPVKLDAAVAAFARKVDQPAKEGTVRFADGAARPRYPTAGSALDQSAAADAVRKAFLQADQTVPLRTRRVAPEISKRDVSRAMNSFANPAISAPVVVVLGGENVVLRPDDFDAALSMVPEDGRLVPHLDAARLLHLIAPKLKTIALAPRDASVRIVDGRPKVIPAKVGVSFRPAQITGKFLDLLTRHDRSRTLHVKSVLTQPDVTTADVKKLGITAQVSEFTTHFPYAAYRNTNLGRAAELVNGTVLKPGDTFSLNKIVGERTPANGFTKGFIISDGVYAEDYGGGVSQVATTTFNAAFFAGLQDVAHKTHSFYIDRYPAGREATVAWPSVDLKFKDDTPYGVLVQAWIDKSTPSSQGAMHVRMWSTRYWDIKAGASGRYDLTKPGTRHLTGPGCVPNQGYGGFDIDVYRYFYRHGAAKLDHKETTHTTYAPSDSVICS